MTVSDQLDGPGPGPGPGQSAQATAAKHKTNSEQKQVVPNKQELWEFRKGSPVDKKTSSLQPRTLHAARSSTTSYLKKMQFECNTISKVYVTLAFPH
jgi:hypothetical protein